MFALSKGKVPEISTYIHTNTEMCFNTLYRLFNYFPNFKIHETSSGLLTFTRRFSLDLPM